MIAVVVGPMISGPDLETWAHAELKRCPFVAFVAVDGGYRALLEAGLLVTAWIGDGDSLGKLSREEKREFAQIPSLKLPRAKDRSDLAYALGFCFEGLAASEIRAVGFQGGRFDHEWAACLEFSHAATRVEKMTSFGPLGEMHFLSAGKKAVRWEREGLRKGRLVSLFPMPSLMAPRAVGVKVAGLRFTPSGGILEATSQGLSNEAVAKRVEIRLRKGSLLVILPKEENARKQRSGSAKRRS